MKNVMSDLLNSLVNTFTAVALIAFVFASIFLAPLDNFVLLFATIFTGMALLLLLDLLLTRIIKYFFR